MPHAQVIVQQPAPALMPIPHLLLSYANNSFTACAACRKPDGFFLPHSCTSAHSSTRAGSQIRTSSDL
jgi:hypothetical protein